MLPLSPVISSFLILSSVGFSLGSKIFAISRRNSHSLRVLPFLSVSKCYCRVLAARIRLSSISIVLLIVVLVCRWIVRQSSLFALRGRGKSCGRMLCSCVRTMNRRRRLDWTFSLHVCTQRGLAFRKNVRLSNLSLCLGWQRTRYSSLDLLDETRKRWMEGEKDSGLNWLWDNDCLTELYNTTMFDDVLQTAQPLSIKLRQRKLLSHDLRLIAHLHILPSQSTTETGRKRDRRQL